jgi:hypothetical protein
MNRVFAHVLPDGTIDQIIVIAEEDVGGLPFPDSEPVGQAFIRSLYANSDLWLETSESGAFRGRYAVIGGGYDSNADEFTLAPQPVEES